MGNRASIIFLNDKQTEEYLENQEGFELKAGDNYIYIHWNGGVESVCAFVDFARFLGIHKLEVGKKYIEFYAMLRNFFYDIDRFYEYGIFEKYVNRHGTIELETLDCDKNVNEGLYFNNKPCVTGNDFEIISYTAEELEVARKDAKYQEIFNGLKKQYAKIETQICESVIDGKKLAIELKQEKSYEWLINDNNGSYSEDKHELGIVLVNNLRFMSEEYDNNAEYGIYEAWTKENIDAVCVMLDEMFEFCNKRQIKYINLN